jgi:hypothetical protein
MARLPVVPVKYPAALAGVTNGKVPATLLRTAKSLHKGQPVTLLAVAMRSFLAMRAAAEADGVRLEAISSYRTYAKQVALFTERYVPHYAVHTDGRVRYRIWQGRRWYHAFGPTTAVPGTSNHGRALAIDFVRGPAWLDWMLDEADRFGWSWEIQDEEWHLRYVAGDAIPAAVLAYENPDPADPPSVPKEPLVSFYLILSTKKFYAVRPWRPHVQEITKEDAYLLGLGGAVFVRVPNMTIFTRICSGWNKAA